MNSDRTPGYVRISLLSACNLRCSYCRPAGIYRPTIKAPADKVRAAIRFLHQFGINKIRFTGGEPTLYKDLDRLILFTKKLDVNIHTAITSNGILLESRARELSEAGLDSVNISLDTLDAAKFRALTGRNKLDRIISGIYAAVEHIGNVKLNCVLMRGINDDEVADLISFAGRRRLDIRFIEFMPNRYSARGDSRFISSQEIRTRLPWNLQQVSGKPNSAARYYTSSSLRMRIGFISSVSHPFCDNCDRIRLTADGHLYTCLYNSSNINLFELLDTDPEQAEAQFKELIKSKRFSGCHGTIDSATSLPSFSAMGG